jgi:hypothetical protein
MKCDDDTELGSDGRPSAGGGPALLRSSNTRMRQQNGSHSREESPAAVSRMQDAGGQDDSVLDERDVDLLLPTAIQGPVDASCCDIPTEPVVMARESRTVQMLPWRRPLANKTDLGG